MTTDQRFTIERPTADPPRTQRKIAARVAARHGDWDWSDRDYRDEKTNSTAAGPKATPADILERLAPFYADWEPTAPDGLTAEYHRLELPWKALQRLSAYGVPPYRALTGGPCGMHLCGLADVYCEGGAFQFADTPIGARRLLIAVDAVVTDPDPDCPAASAFDVVELVAFDPKQPARWWVRSGADPVLGRRALARAFPDQPPRLVATPLDWLRAGGNAIAVLDWDGFDPVVTLGPIDTIRAATQRLRDAVLTAYERRMSRLIPTIEVEAHGNA